MFTVTVDGTAVTLTGNSGISGATVPLTLATALTSSTQSVTVSYAAPWHHLGRLEDLAGNPVANFSNQAVTNRFGATVNVSAIAFTSDPNDDGRTGDDNTYAVGDTVAATVTFDDAVDITGTPQLTLLLGRTEKNADCAAATNTTTMVCSYEVAANDAAPAGVAIKGNTLALNGGTIRAAGSTTSDASLTHTTVAAQAAHKVDGVKPTLVATGRNAPRTSADGTKVILTFSEDIGSVDRTRITLIKTLMSATSTLATIAASTSGDTVEITLMTALTSSDTSVTVELAAATVDDLAGNGNAAVAETTVTTADNTAPTLTGVSTLLNDTVQLLYDEALDLTSQPAERAFTVEVGGVAREVTTVSFSGDRRVNLVLGSAFRPGDTLTVSYEKPGTGPIQDEAGNDAASFAGELVSNTLAATAPEAPGNLVAEAETITTTPFRVYGDKLELQWSAPWPNGDPITKFQVRHGEGSTVGGTWADIPGSGGGTTEHTVTGLKPDTEYTLEVRAVNGIGYGAEDTVTQRTPTPDWRFTLTSADGSPVTELTEGGDSATSTVSIINGVRFSTDQTVQLERGGSRLGNGRIQGAGGTDTITIPAGQSSGSLEISAPEPGGTASYAPPSTGALSAIHAGRQVGESIDLTFVDDEPPPAASIARASTEVSEGDDIEIRISLSLPTPVPIGIRLAVTDPAGALSGTPPGVAVLAAFETAQTVTLTAADNEVQNDGARAVTLTLALNPPDIFTLGEPSSVTVTVLDNDTPPSVPRNLTAEAGNAEARLAWEAPETDHGQPVTGYEYRRKAGTGSFGAWADIPGSDRDTTGYTVTRLTNGTLYTFEVRAVNIAGGGAASNEASATPATTPGKLRAPQISPGDGRVIAQWLAPASDGGLPILRYEYCLEPIFRCDGAWVAIPGSAPGGANHGRYAIARDNGVWTIVLLRAVNARGAGPHANRQAVPRAGAPGAPANLRFEALSAEHVRISWDEPAAQTGTTITGYDLERSRDGVTWADDPGCNYPCRDQYLGSRWEPRGTTSVTVRIGPIYTTLHYRIRTAFRTNSATIVNGMNLSDGFSPTSQILEVSTVGRTGSLALPQVGVADGYGHEGVNAAIVFDVRLTGAYRQTSPVSVTYRTQDGTAKAGIDYTARSGTLVFEPGETEKTVSVPIIDDAVEDSGESFALLLGDVSGAHLSRAGGLGTIYNREDILSGFTLVSAASGTDLGPLEHGATVTLDDPANGEYGVRAQTAPDTGVNSVRFQLSGAKTVTRTDNEAPFTLHAEGGEGLPPGAYTLQATAWPETDRGGNALQTISIAFTVAASTGGDDDGGPEDTGLTASFGALPSEHGGPGERFTFELTFSEAPEMSYRRVRDHAFTVTGGTIRRAQRLERPSNLRWRITVEPSGWGAVALTLPGGRACTATGAICTADGRMVSNSPSATIEGPGGLSAADARAREGTDAALEFAVTLDRASTRTVTVHYATANGTATAGEDYTARSGTLTFAPGDVTRTVSIPVLDDAKDEGEETMTLTLSNASGARIADGAATGTIVNSDPLQNAWIARFGRTVAGQVVDAIGSRFSGGGTPGVTVGGQSLDPTGGAADEALARDRLLVELAEPKTAPQVLGMTGRELLLASSFSVGGGGEPGAPSWGAWGRFATESFDGEVDGMRLQGDVTTGLLGADVARDRWLAGVAVSVSRGEGPFRLMSEMDSNRESGTVESSLTALYPYAKLGLSDRVEAWAIVGRGHGELTIDESGGTPIETDLGMTMGAVGARGQLLSASEGGGLDLAIRSDATWVRMKSDAVSNLAAAQAHVSRLRLVAEGSRTFAMEGGRTIAPRGELGVRHDLGDAETGTGVEAGAGVKLVGDGFSIEGAVRALVAHEDAHYREWGASGSIVIDPGAAGRGLSLTVAPTWGNAASAAARLWSVPDAGGLVRADDFEAKSRVEAELGYGVGAPHGPGLVTPYAGLTLSDGAPRALRTGVRWNASQSATMSLEASREGQGSGEAPTNALTLRAEARW